MRITFDELSTIIVCLEENIQGLKPEALKKQIKLAGRLEAFLKQAALSTDNFEINEGV